MTTTTTDKAISATNSKFSYDVQHVNELRVEYIHVEKPAKKGETRVPVINIDGEQHKPSNRFWGSLFSRYGFNRSIFKYFSHAEVFERITATTHDKIRLCVETTEKGEKNLLAVSNPNKPVVDYDQLMDLFSRATSEKLTYSNGIIESVHTPRNGHNPFDICGDAFTNKFMLSTPVDGYGLPSLYLMMMRLICSNGTVGYTGAFKSSVPLGKANDNIAFALLRVLDQFGSDEGYAALRQRIESAGSSWASVNESMTLYKLLLKLHNEKAEVEEDDAIRMNLSADSPHINGLLASSDRVDNLGSPAIKAFHAMTGDVSELYGLANIDALSAKRQRTLPVKCTVYDMVNFATEMATHHTSSSAARRLNGWVGELLANEYDMEGTGEKFHDFADFHISSKLANQMTGSGMVA